jgi:diacylglycerol O-acyltransferase
MASKSLSSVDTAWLRMEDPTNLMMISGVMVFDAPLDFDRLRSTIERGLLRFDRFRWRVAWDRNNRPRWEEDPSLSLDYHLKRIQLAAPADQEALEAVASELASTPLDMARPLWQFHLIEHYGPGSALVCRLHHCIGDGLALVHVLLSLTSADAESPAWFEMAEPPAPRPSAPPPKHFPRTRRLLRTAFRTTRTLVADGMSILVQPSLAVDLANKGWDAAKALAILVGRWPDPKTPLKGPLGVPKRTAWSAPLALGDVKFVGRALGGTVNDALLTAVAGGLRTYLQGRGEPVEGLRFRAIVPVNLRKPGTEAELGNKFSLFFLSLPVGLADPLERLHELKQRMDGLKGTLEAPVAFGILTAIGMSPKVIQDIVANIFGTKGTAVMTNVVGPRVKLYLAGAPLDSLMFWVPQAARLGMGVSILSYADKVWLGVITDSGLVPDPGTVVDGFNSEFEALLVRARQVKEQAGTAQMSRMLDEALVALNELVAQKAVSEPGAEPPGAEVPQRCQALTREGLPCKNLAHTGSTFCRVHQK